MDMGDLKKIFRTISGYRDEIISFQTALTSKPALGPDNGGTGEHEKAEYVKERLKELKPDSLIEIKAPDDRAKDGYRPNLIARWKRSDNTPFVWVLSHMDIVPPGDLSLWKGDPYKVRVEGDNIIGRGVEDNQHGMVSSYLALKAVLNSDEGLGRNVGLVMVADEETGSKYGLEYILKNHKDIFNKDDLIIVPDWGSEDGSMIEVAEKSMLWIKIIVTGQQCHASTPDMGKNSLYGVARLIIDLDSINKEFSMEDRLFSPPISTFVPTKIEANVPNINTIPGRDVFYIDCRILPVYQVDNVIGFVEKICRKVEKDLDLSIKVEPVNREDAVNPTSSDSPVVKALQKAIKKVKGLDSCTMGIGGGTVAAFFRQAGFPAAVWGTSIDSAHQPNEYCKISDIIADTKIFASIFMDDSIE
jgi:succinyl-diaminopimelate desuccinylase